jgi:simple sugar transport system substrate-binding protein
MTSSFTGELCARRSVRGAAAVALLAAAAFAAPTVSAVADDAPLKIIYVSPLSPGNLFAIPMLKGYELAGKQVGADVTYRGNQDPNLWAAAGDTKRMLENAIASKPDGLVITDTYPEVLNDTIKAAVESGIPVVLSNAGINQAEATKALGYVGVDEEQMGELGGKKLRELGATNVLVVTVPPGIPLVDQRIEGFKKGIAPQKATFVEVPVEALGDSTRLVNTMLASLEKDPTIDGIFSIGSCCGPAMVAVRDQIGDRANKMKFGTIDLGAAVLDALKEKKIDFGIDQQQYLQGYLPVVMLANYIRFGIEPADGIYHSGPSLITSENAAKVADLTEKGYR